MAAAPASEALALARTLTSRLTHDLGSPLGTLAGMLDMLEASPRPEDAELLTVAREAAGQLRARLRLQAVAWGLGAEATDLPALQALLAGSVAAQRVAFHFAGPLLAAPIAAVLVPLLLNGALVAAEALPRGGEVRISASAQDLAFLPEGRNAAWPAELLAAFSGAPEAALAAGPRRVVAPLLLAQAAEQGFAVALLPGMGPGLPPLLLSRR